MKRSKRLIALLGCLALLCGGTLLLTHMEESKEQIRSAGETVLAVPAEEIRSLNWEYGDTSLAFHKEDTWLYDGDEAFPVSEEKIGELLEEFETFSVSFAIEEVTDFGMYGLDDPVCVIEFATEEQTFTVKLGDFSKMDAQRYVSIGDGNVYLAKTDPLEKFDATLKDMIRHDETLSYEQVSQITFRGAENHTVFYEEDSSAAHFADDVYFTRQNGETLPLDTGRVETYLEALTTLDLTDYVTYKATDEALERYGLQDPELTVTVDYTDRDGAAQTYTLAVSRDPEELAAAEEAEAAGEEPEEVTAYVRVGESPIVYRVSEYSANNLLAASCNELRHREVLSADFETVTQIDVTLEGKTHTFLTNGTDEDDQPIWQYNGEEVTLTTLQNALESLRVEYSADFTDEQPTGKRELGVTVHLDSASRAQVRIDLYRHDGEHCLAMVDGAPVALISRSDVVELIEAVNALVL